MDRIRIARVRSTFESIPDVWVVAIVGKNAVDPWERCASFTLAVKAAAKLSESTGLEVELGVT